MAQPVVFHIKTCSEHIENMLRIIALIKERHPNAKIEVEVAV